MLFSLPVAFCAIGPVQVDNLSDYGCLLTGSLFTIMFSAIEPAQLSVNHVH